MVLGLQRAVDALSRHPLRRRPHPWASRSFRLSILLPADRPAGLMQNDYTDKERTTEERAKKKEEKREKGRQQGMQTWLPLAVAAVRKTGITIADLCLLLGYFSLLGLKCQHEFCWDCLVSHLLVLEKDNSVHKRYCRWHPQNLRD
ncbi:hypothetical protein B0T22DRAFT_246181 [Podospora appendiculata]|uniref:Uncharacterized protein n=1 Tax=Podospora appendiculata TaxID=314037 RepID=A0AAE1C8T3_9PEZI|nr:hypothetical protein B0T22DRAFT_246181 [Podospora appendiculata]